MKVGMEVLPDMVRMRGGWRISASRAMQSRGGVVKGSYVDE